MIKRYTVYTSIFSVATKTDLMCILPGGCKGDFRDRATIPLSVLARIFPAHRTRSGWMITISNKAVIGRNFQILQVTQVCANLFSFVKRYMSILFPVNCGWTNFFFS